MRLRRRGSGADGGMRGSDGVGRRVDGLGAVLVVGDAVERAGGVARGRRGLVAERAGLDADGGHASEVVVAVAGLALARGIAADDDVALERAAWAVGLVGLGALEAAVLPGRRKIG